MRKQAISPGAKQAWLVGAKVLVFDFDGTLVDSNMIKARAFERCFAAFPDRLPEILNYCLGHHHTPRDVKFRVVYEQILRIPYTAQVEQALLNRFEEQTTQPIVEAPEIPGAGQFLEWASARFPTGVLSSTPDPILRKILRRRGWERFFSWVQGAPVDKAAWLRRLFKQERLRGKELLFFGDTEEDYRAGTSAGCLFVAVGSNSGTREFPRWIRDFTDLDG